jgi:glycosyltransferase involved in cell wall biosynthesis
VAVPRFSIVTPVYNTPTNVLQACIDSVRSQTFTDWEWCLVDDSSTDARVRKVLDKARKQDPRIRVAHRSANGGIIAASRDALDMATGEFIVLLDHDDELHPDALRLVAAKLDDDDTIDYLYTDEDKIDLEGNHFDVFRKPDFDPIRLLGQNYCSHLSVFRSSIVDDVGGFRDGFEGSQDFDLVLRVVERARTVAHVPRVLYHWRALPGSTAELQHAKPYALESSVRAVREHLDRTGQHADVRMSDDGFIQVFPHLAATPKVSIVIPTRGDSQRIWGQHTNLVAYAVDSILRHTTYPDFEIVVVYDYRNGEPVHPVQIPVDWRVKVVPYDAPFNFSDKCNVGVRQSSGDVVVLLNDDVYVDDPTWLHALVAMLQLPDVAMAGPLLVLEDGRIQSAGHTNEPTPHSLGTGESGTATGLFGMYRVSRRVSGVTAACAAIRRDAYDALGGFSIDFPACFNDLDFGYKIIEAGWHIVWTPLARVYHFESLTRDPAVQPHEMAMLERRWKRYFGREEFSKLSA